MRNNNVLPQCLTYTKLKQNRRRLVVLTGITPRAFQPLLRAFQTAYEERYPPTLTMVGAPRQRHIGAGRKGLLDRLEQKLLFALVYQRIHPSQHLLGAAFGLSQTRANRWVNLLLPVLGQACKGLEQCSEGTSRLANWREVWAQRSSSISSLQRRHAGLKDLEKYALDYTSRNKNHSNKHVVPGDGKLIGCPDQTQLGKTADT